jgi:hypothetical protein
MGSAQCSRPDTVAICGQLQSCFQLIHGEMGHGGSGGAAHLVRVTIGRYDVPEVGDDGERIHLIESKGEGSAQRPPVSSGMERREGGAHAGDYFWRSLCEDRVGNFAELETRKDTTGFEDAKCLGENTVDVGAVADAKSDCVKILRVGVDLVKLLCVT